MGNCRLSNSWTCHRNKIRGLLWMHYVLEKCLAIPTFRCLFGNIQSIIDFTKKPFVIKAWLLFLIRKEIGVLAFNIWDRFPEFIIKFIINEFLEVFQVIPFGTCKKLRNIRFGQIFFNFMILEKFVGKFKFLKDEENNVSQIRSVEYQNLLVNKYQGYYQRFDWIH